MKISEEKIREDVENREEDLTNFIETLEILQKELQEQDLKAEVDYLIDTYKDEQQDYEKRVEEYNKEDIDYLNAEYRRNQL